MHTAKFLKKITILTTAILLCGYIMGTMVFAEEVDSIYTDEISLLKGELVSVKVYALTRVSVADPDIADITDANDQEVLIIGQHSGDTALFLWDEHGKRTIMLYVYDKNLELMANRAKRLLKDAGIYETKVIANEDEGKVVIAGAIPEEKQAIYDEVIVTLGDGYIDLVTEEVVQDLVQIDMQITELNTTLSKSLGIDWSAGDRSGISPNYEEDEDVAFDGSIGDFFKIGDFRRTGQLVAAVNALITEGKGRILSKPKLVVISGEEARFLVGGEIPIRTTTFSDTGSSQENVEFKEYGISMTMTPTIKKDKVDVVMNLEVSEIDASTASTVSEDVAFSTRSASTHLFLDDAQTIVLAGLIKHSESKTLSKVPFMGDIPIIGLLFRSRSNPVPDQDQELVIALTPHILRQTEPQKMTGNVSARNEHLMEKMGDSRKFYQDVAPYYLGIPKEMTGYVHDVQQKISQAIIYPREARQYGWEGTVKVGLLILNDGTLAFALLKESSGYEVFDELALSTTKKLAPFEAFPPDTDLQELNVTIPIVYSLNK